MNPHWFPSAAELRRIEAWALHTTVTITDMAAALNAPVDAVRAIVRDNGWRS